MALTDITPTPAGSFEIDLDDEDDEDDGPTLFEGAGDELEEDPTSEASIQPRVARKRSSLSTNR